jgi:hypothetical protein
MDVTQHEPPAARSVQAAAKQGKPGPTGPAGPRGPAGPIATDFVVANGTLPATLGATITANADCANLSGAARVISGGFDTGVDGAASADVTVNAALAITFPPRYQVTFTRTGTTTGGDIAVSAVAVCTE